MLFDNTIWNFLIYSSILYRTPAKNTILYKDRRTWSAHWRCCWSSILLRSRKRTIERRQRTCGHLFGSFDFSLNLYLHNRYCIVCCGMLLDLSDWPLVVVHDGVSSGIVTSRHKCLQHSMVHTWCTRRKRPFDTCIKSALDIPHSISHMFPWTHSKVN